MITIENFSPKDTNVVRLGNCYRFDHNLVVLVAITSNGASNYGLMHIANPNVHMHETYATMQAAHDFITSPEMGYVLFKGKMVIHCD